MINFNGKIIDDNELYLSVNNRAFKFGDGIFDTLKYHDGKVYFIEDHYFRLMSSMRMLRMRIPMSFTLEYYEEQITKLLGSNKIVDSVRIRTTVYRVDGGYYHPLSNEVNFVIEADPILIKKNAGTYKIELFKDFLQASGLLSTIKTNNRMINVLASIFAAENNFQNCVLINERKQVVEAMNANIFLIHENEIRTPALDSGCINGIIRKKLIEGLNKNKTFDLIETEISPFDLLKADEVFLTNSIMEIQSVSQYRKKSYETSKTAIVKVLLEEQIKGIMPLA